MCLQFSGPLIISDFLQYFCCKGWIFAGHTIYTRQTSGECPWEAVLQLSSADPSRGRRKPKANLSTQRRCILKASLSTWRRRIPKANFFCTHLSQNFLKTWRESTICNVLMELKLLLQILCMKTHSLVD